MISNQGALPRVALIGVTGYAIVYVDWLLEAYRNRRLEIVAISVLPSERELPIVATFEKMGAKVFDSYEQLFSDGSPDVDLCFIPTGIQWHARMAIAALRGGCNVLVEKPLAGSVEDVMAVQEAESETGHWVAVGFQDMYTEEIRWLKKALVSGKIGTVKSVSMLGAWPRPTSYYTRNHWAGRLYADDAQVFDSPLNNAFAHFINLSLFLAGATETESTRATVTHANLYRAHDIESFDTAIVQAESGNGVEFWFGVSHSCRQAIQPSIRIEGTKGHAIWSHEKSCSLLYGNEREERKVPKYAATRSTMFSSVLEKMSAPETRVCDPSVAICHTALIESIHRDFEIKSVAASEISICALPDGTEVPCIAGIEDKLQAAFQTRSAVEDIECQPANV